MDLTGRTIEQIRFEALIGRGGMGAVYRAFDLRLKRRVAVKVLRDHSRRAAEARGRFMREARLLSRLDHPGICRVYDLIVHPEANLLVLELIDGQTLREVDAADWPLAKQLELARDIADALAAAHRQLVLHRDLKPDNVMLTASGQAKILDFGIARPLVEEIAAGQGRPQNETGARDLQIDIDELDFDPEDDEITLFAGAFSSLKAEADHAPAPKEPAPGETFHTLRGTTVGTVAYMSPEQALGHELTVASDMYAFGILLQELFTGERAYPQVDVLHLFQLVARAEPKPIEGVDRELTELIRELEHRDSRSRPSAEEARDRLQTMIDRPTLERRRRRRLLTSLAALLLIATAVGAIIYSRFESRRQAAIAERFAQQASAVEWLVRAEHLSPPHDLTSARQKIDAQLTTLARQLPAKSGPGRAAGSYALGRAHLALDDLDKARSYLQQAWDGGYRLPEVDSYLGLAMVRLYARESETVRRLPSEKERLAKLEKLDQELRLPGVERLKSGRFAEDPGTGSSPLLSIEPVHYPQALIAFGEGRFDDALEAASAAAAQWPWFYEAELLAAQVEHRRALDAVGRGDIEPALDAFARARSHAERAAESARSDPKVATEQCSIEKSILDIQISHTLLDDEELTRGFDRGEAACRRAHDLSPRYTPALGLLASLLQRGAESGATGATESDPRPRLAEAATFAQKAVEIDGEDAAAWKSLGDIYSMHADWEFYRGFDPTPVIDRMQAAYQNAARLDPHDGSYVNALGNALCFRGEVDAKAGRDPRPNLIAAAEAYRRSDRLGTPGQGGQALINLAICSMPMVHYEIAIGADPVQILETIDDALQEALPRSEGAFRLWRQLGEMASSRALRRVLWGGDVVGMVSSAEQALERTLELYPAEVHARTARMRLAIIAARLEDGAEAEEYLARAETLSLGLLDEVPNWLPALLGRAQIARHRVAFQVADGEKAKAELRIGAKSLRSYLEEDPSDGQAHLELARLLLTRAAVEAEGTATPSASLHTTWNRVEVMLEEAEQLWPGRPDVILAMAALERHRFDLTADAEALEKADAHLERAQKLRRPLTERKAPDFWLEGATLEGQLRWPP